MRYKEMLQDAKAKGLANEQKMWDSIGAIDDLLCDIKQEHPDVYWRFLREQHGIMYGGHYSEDYAEHDVKHIVYKDKEGKEHHGGRWSRDEVCEMTQGMTFPQGTTDCDKWVAYNVMFADTCKTLDDEQVKRVAYAFFFCDDDFDYSQGSKIWHYMAI